MTPDLYCRERAGASGSSLHYSLLFLPPERQSAAMALYAYCRELDDAVRLSSETAVAAAKLDWWQGEIDRLFCQTPSIP